MVNYLNVLKKALADPKLDNLECISDGVDSKLVEILEGLPLDSYISEWKYGFGEIKYEYHIHKGEVAEQLKEAFRNGARGGHPGLTAVYLKKELEALTLKSQVDSGYK